MYELKESDWKKFRKNLKDWQERYMEGLIEEYAEVLKSDDYESSKFWELDKRIKEDKRKDGVLCCDISRSKMTFHLLNLLLEKAISFDDLEEFSPELIEYLKLCMRRYKC